MKNSKVLRNVFYTVIALVMAVTLVSSFKSSHSLAQQQPVINAVDINRYQQGIGTDVQFAKAGVTPARAEDSVRSLTGFIEKRSGLQTSLEFQRRLAQAEADVQNGKAPRIDLTTLNNKVIQLLFERLNTLSDKEIDQVIESLRGFNAPGLPDSFQRGRGTLHMRPSYVSDITPEQAKQQLKALQTKSSQDLVTSFLFSLIKEEINQDIKELATALPKTFGHNWDVNTNQATQGLSPMQAYALLYIGVSGDKGLDNDVNLQKTMKGIEVTSTKVAGSTYPSSEGHKAFGDNGYLYSSPVFLLDEKTQLRFLDLILGGK